MEIKEKCSVDEEMLMWTSYRYCIGRKTYVNTLAYYIASHYYDKLSPKRRQFTSKDIKECINNQLSFGQPALHYGGNVGYENRDSLNDLITYLNEHVNEEKDLIGIGEIEVSQISYTDKTKVFETYPAKYNPTALGFDLGDLLIWYHLAQCFNTKDYKQVWYKSETEEKTDICFETWLPKYEECEDGYYRGNPYKFVKRFIPVNEYLSNPHFMKYVNPDYIIKVEDYDGSKDNRTS